MKDYREIAERVLERRNVYMEAKRIRIRNVKRAATVTSAFCLVTLLGIGALRGSADNNGILDMVTSPLKAICSIQGINGAVGDLEAQSAPDLKNTLDTAVSNGIVSVNYSSLNLPIGQIDADVIMQYGSSSAAVDIAAFDESMLSDCCAVLEGEITDMYVKHYNYDTYHDKFGEKEQYHNMSSSVVYELEVDKVWYGDKFLPGTSVLVEDTFYLTDSYFSLKIGCSYVIPIYSSGETIYLRTEEYAGGDITKDSSYSTLYPHHPQIEVTMDGNYVVTDDWKTLCSGDAIEINMDTFDGRNIEDTLIEYHPQLNSEEGGFVTTEWRTLLISRYDANYYYNKVKLIEADAFRDRLLRLIGTLN